MSDLLVRLYQLPPRSEGEGALSDKGVSIRKARTFELGPVRRFIESNFSESWADEATATFSRQPIPCFIATEDQKIIGFGAYDATTRGYFGPTGVAIEHRGRGIGKALLIASLWGLADLGYAYAIIGAAGPVDFYAKTVGATVIPDSTPGFYTDILQRG
jgi:predicted N-acetyltransferase YhbS